MKTKLFFTVALAAMVALTSCNKEEGVKNQTDETTTVTLTMLQSDSRAETPSQGAQAVTFSSGYVYFVDIDKKITNVFRLVSGTTTNPEEVQISTTAMTFKEVSGSSKHVYILGNVPAQTAVKGDLITTVLAQTTTVQEQTANLSTNESDLKKFMLYGKSANEISHSGANSTVAVTVKPLGSRIEIGQFKAVQKLPDTEFPLNISAYRIDAIFMNNIYLKTTLAGEVTGVGTDFSYYGKEDNGNTPKNFLVGNGIYKAENNKYLYDANETNGIASSSSNIAKPAVGKVWAYNLLAPVTANSEFPHIVIRVSNIEGVPSIPKTELRWMTVTEFLDSSNQPVAFEQGKVYTIESFEFNEYDHLNVSPEMKTVTVNVTVTVPDWTVAKVKPW